MSGHTYESPIMLLPIQTSLEDTIIFVEVVDYRWQNRDIGSLRYLCNELIFIDISNEFWHSTDHSSVPLESQNVPWKFFVQNVRITREVSPMGKQEKCSRGTTMETWPARVVTRLCGFSPLINCNFDYRLATSPSATDFTR